MANSARTASEFISPVRANSSVPPSAAGRPATIPAKMIIEMPLPMPRSVICSPSHIRNMVPVTSDTVAVNTKPTPECTTSAEPPAVCPCSAIEIPMAWKVARNTVP